MGFRQQHWIKGRGGGLMSLFCLEEWSRVQNGKINGTDSRVLSEVSVAWLFGQSILTSSQYKVPPQSTTFMVTNNIKIHVDMTSP